MTTRPNVGAFVLGPPTAPRALVHHSDLMTAYADDDDVDHREAYLSHFVFGEDMRAHYKVNRGSVAGFVGACWCRWLTLDIDRESLSVALDDTRRLVRHLHQRYPERHGDIPIYFSGSKGFNVNLELAHNPIPSVGFHHTAKTFAGMIAVSAGVRIDPAIYDIAHIIRLPNTLHPKTGLFKRRLDADALFALDIDSIRDLAKHPAGDGLPSTGTVPANLASDWSQAEQQTARTVEARTAIRRDHGTADLRAPRYFVDFVRFGVEMGERHQTLFRCAAWLTEQGCPPSLCTALLTEPGCDVGLSPKDVARQIQCGIDHAHRQSGQSADPGIDPDDLRERWCVEHESDPLPPGATDFAFGALAPAESEGGLQA